MARRHVTRIAVAVAVLAVVSFGVLLLVDRLVTPEDLEESLAPAPSPPVTVAVEEKVIRTTVAGRALVAYENTVTVALSALPGLGGSLPLLTGIPERSVELVAGDVLAEVAYRPVILLQGDAPLVRDLSAGDQGPDVVMVQQALLEMGLIETADIDGVFGPVTAAAVTALYEEAGYPAPSLTGTVYAPAAELFVTPLIPLVVRETLVQVGDSLSPGSDIVTVSAPGAHLVVGLPSFEAGLLNGGVTAAITDDVTGRTTSGRVTRIGAAPDPEVGGVPVIVAYDGGLSDDRDYRVTLEIETTGGPVLAVPETALYLGSGDSPYVLRATGAFESEPVSVTIGLVGSDGFAQVTPVDEELLRVGDRVVVGAES